MSDRSIMARKLIVRWKRVIQLLRAGKTMGEAATSVEVSLKTVQRDIEYLREQMGFEITTPNHVASPRRTNRVDGHCPFCDRPINSPPSTIHS